MLKQTRSRSEDLIKRQTGMLQNHRPKKGNIQVCAASTRNSIREVIQGFHGVECAELPPRVQVELELSLDPPCHYRLMISIVHDECGTFGKTGGKLGLEFTPGYRGLYKSRVVLGITCIGK